MMTDIERHDRRRRVILFWYAAAFFVWSGTLAIMFAGPMSGRDLPASTMPWLLGLQLSAMGVWFVTLALLMIFGTRVQRDPDLRAALNDENSRANQSRAFVIGFWVTIALAALSIPLAVAGGVALGAPTLAVILIWASVSTVIFTFVFLEHRDAS